VQIPPYHIISAVGSSQPATVQDLVTNQRALGSSKVEVLWVTCGRVACHLPVRDKPPAPSARREALVVLALDLQLSLKECIWVCLTHCTRTQGPGWGSLHSPGSGGSAGCGGSAPSLLDSGGMGCGSSPPSLPAL